MSAAVVASNVSCAWTAHSPSAVGPFFLQRWMRLRQSILQQSHREVAHLQRIELRGELLQAGLSGAFVSEPALFSLVDGPITVPRRLQTVARLDLDPECRTDTCASTAGTPLGLQVQFVLLVIDLHASRVHVFCSLATLSKFAAIDLRTSSCFPAMSRPLDSFNRCTYSFCASSSSALISG